MTWIIAIIFIGMGNRLGNHETISLTRDKRQSAIITMYDGTHAYLANNIYQRESNVL